MDISKVGTKEWNDSAECGEWSFMAKMMREAQAFIPHNLSGLQVAIDIADARAKEGWRTAVDVDFPQPYHHLTAARQINFPVSGHMNAAVSSN